MTNSKDLSPFGLAALTLDQDFSLMTRLARQIENLDIESDNGFEQARKLLARFSECGQRIEAEVKDLASTMEAARVQAEQAAGIVSQRAIAIQERHQKAEE